MTREEARHKARLVELGCLACRRLFNITDGPVELHHYRGGGWGRGDFRTLLGLCVEHHRGNTGVHGLGTRGFDKHYGFTQRDLLDDALRLLGLVDEFNEPAGDAWASNPAGGPGEAPAGHVDQVP